MEEAFPDVISKRLRGLSTNPGITGDPPALQYQGKTYGEFLELNREARLSSHHLIFCTPSRHGLCEMLMEVSAVPPFRSQVM